VVLDEVEAEAREFSGVLGQGAGAFVLNAARR